MPPRKIMSSTMMMVRVRLAFVRVGSRKAATPLETASTPVMAVQPLEKTLASSHNESIDVADGRCGGAMTGIGCRETVMTRNAPSPMTKSSVPMNM
jgi:hypothetical protein